jgi:hypothetical protein
MKIININHVPKELLDEVLDVVVVEQPAKNVSIPSNASITTKLRNLIFLKSISFSGN